MKSREFAVVAEQTEIASGIFSLWLETESIAKEAVPGQFVSVYSKDKSRMLPRPISICEADKENGKLRLVYRVVGEGTDEFSHLTKGDQLEIIGPMGNGFPLKGEKPLLMGGGIGVPPMVQLGKTLKANGCTQVQTIAGYRDELFLTEELGASGVFYVATEDGSAGTKGNVLDAVREQGIEADVIYACGPKPMQRKRDSSAIFPWKSVWPVESVLVLPVFVSPKRRMNILRYTISVSAKMDRYF